jgi:methyl-accepting chemotaxis protein
MLLSLNGKIRSGYVLAFVLLLISYLLILHSTRQLRKETNWLNHGYIVLNKLSSINSGVMQVETSIRGYMMSKEPALLEDYDQSRKAIPGFCNDLTALVEDNPSQASKVNTLHRLVIERLSLLDYAVRNFDSAGQRITGEITANRPRSLQLIDSIHLVCRPDSGK